MKITCKNQAYILIASSAYHGPCKGFTIANYVMLQHQVAYNELLELDEPVAESKKISDFLVKGIRDPNLIMAKSAAVLGDPVKVDNFEECQQYFSTIMSNLSN